MRYFVSLSLAVFSVLAIACAAVAQSNVTVSQGPPTYEGAWWVGGADGGPVSIVCPDGTTTCFGSGTSSIDGGFLTIGLADGGVLGGIASTVTVQGAIGLADGGVVVAVPVVGAQNYCNQSGMATTTGCTGLSGVGLSFYISSFACSANAAIQCGLVSSTTNNNACATSPVLVFTQHYIPANGGFSFSLPVPIKVTPNSTICCTPSAGVASCTVVFTVAP